MSKIRPDYEMTKWRRFLRFVNGEELLQDWQERTDEARAIGERMVQLE